MLSYNINAITLSFLTKFYCRGSQNATRELENRQKVENMVEAMQTLNDLTEEKRFQEITKRQVCIMSKHNFLLILLFLDSIIDGILSQQTCR